MLLSGLVLAQITPKEMPPLDGIQCLASPLKNYQNKFLNFQKNKNNKQNPQLSESGNGKGSGTASIAARAEGGE